MKKLLNLGIILIALLFLTSCEKDSETTDLDKIEKELKSFVSENGITQCTIILMAGESTNIVYTDESFIIDGGFVIIKRYVDQGTTEDRFNLLYLSRYTKSVENKLELYFADTHL